MKKLLLAVAFVAATPVAALANPIAAGFDANTYLGNDDGSYPTNGPDSGAPSGTPVAQNLGFAFNFYGTSYTDTFINNNGNLTFGDYYSTYTPTALTDAGVPPILAPFFADVDTRVGNLVTFGTGLFDGHAAFGVNWPGVGYFSEETDKTNTFQVLIVDRSDIAAGDADVYFNYGDMLWETGDVSGGSDGLGGSCAHVGYSNGTGNSGTHYELPGSGVCGALLDSGLNALSSNTNDGVTGQYLFEVRGGTIAPPSNGVPEPLTLSLFATGLAGLGFARRKRA